MTLWNFRNEFWDMNLNWEREKINGNLQIFRCCSTCSQSRYTYKQTFLLDLTSEIQSPWYDNNKPLVTAISNLSLQELFLDNNYTLNNLTWTACLNYTIGAPLFHLIAQKTVLESGKQNVQQTIEKEPYLYQLNWWFSTVLMLFFAHLIVVSVSIRGFYKITCNRVKFPRLNHCKWMYCIKTLIRAAIVVFCPFHTEGLLWYTTLTPCSQTFGPDSNKEVRNVQMVVKRLFNQQADMHKSHLRDNELMLATVLVTNSKLTF